MAEDKYEQISGRSLADLRRQRGYSQDDWARLMGYTTSGLRRIEPLDFAQIYRTKFRQLAERIGVSIDKLRELVKPSQHLKLQTAKRIPGVQTGSDLAAQPRQAASASPKARKKMDEKEKLRREGK